MENDKITTISKENIPDFKSKICKIYYNGCYITEAKRDNSTILEYPVRIDTFFVMICRKGEGKISVNMNEHTIHENSIFVNSPNNILHANGNSDIEGVVIGFEPTFVSEVKFDIKNILPLFLKLHENPVIDIDKTECDKLLKIIESLADEITHSQDEPYHKDIIVNYFSLFLYKLCSIMSIRLQAMPKTEQSVKNRNEEYFKKFMAELQLNYKRERTVGFYASQLCITPKYLTTLIKRVSGRSAAEWIDQYVILEAKNLLRYSTMSIQEVSYHLNFPNQSFFGKYFKHHTGYSPSAYKLLK